MTEPEEPQPAWTVEFDDETGVTRVDGEPVSTFALTDAERDGLVATVQAVLADDGWARGEQGALHRERLEGLLLRVER